MPPPAASPANMPPTLWNGLVYTVRDCEAATMLLKLAAVRPETEALRIGSSCPSGKSFTATAARSAGVSESSSPISPMVALASRRTTMA